jgi:hypothetical protein
MNIGFISGTGKEGKALAIRFGMYGHSVVIGSRSKENSEKVVKEIKSIFPNIDAQGMSYSETAYSTDIIFLALPYKVVSEEILAIKHELKNKIVVDTSVPIVYSEGKFSRDRNLINSVSDDLNSSLPNTEVISAFHTISHSDLNNVSKELDHDLLYFVNDAFAETSFLSLINGIKGLNPIRCGTLDLSILIESQVPLLLNINKAYKKSTSIKIKGF